MFLPERCRSLTVPTWSPAGPSEAALSHRLWRGRADRWVCVGFLLSPDQASSFERCHPIWTCASARPETMPFVASRLPRHNAKTMRGGNVHRRAHTVRRNTAAVASCVRMQPWLRYTPKTAHSPARGAMKASYQGLSRTHQTHHVRSAGCVVYRGPPPRCFALPVLAAI